MKVTLAAAWHPRGELERFLKLAPILREVYQHLVISVPPSAGPELERAVRSTGVELISNRGLGFRAVCRPASGPGERRSVHSLQ